MNGTPCKPLQSLSARPELLVDPAGDAVFDVTPDFLRNKAPDPFVGRMGPLGRGRLVTALPTNKTKPVQLTPYRALADPSGCLLADPSDNLVGMQALWCHRLLYATKTHDTRRL
jgi:hypothetical protein